MTQTPIRKTNYPKAVAGMLLVVLLPIPLFFITAGRWDWWEAWLYFGLMLTSSVASRALMLALQPDQARERARWTDSQDVPAWDRRLMPLLAVYVPWLVYLSAGIDQRLHATPQLPVWLVGAAFAVNAAGIIFSAWAMLANRFFSSVARLQTDRGQTVVRGGPYRWVRHPGYAGALLAFLALPAALNALWAYAAVALYATVLVTRTALEDRMLRNGLPGYEEYARETRWRLLPGVW